MFYFYEINIAYLYTYAVVDIDIQPLSVAKVIAFTADWSALANVLR